MPPYDHPIPIHKSAPTAGGYRDIPIDADDPRYAEPLVDARAHGIAGENYYARADGRNTPYDDALPGAVQELWCRESIVAMLVRANARLAEYGAEVYLWDAYRPVACQQAIWDFFWALFSKEMPHADDAVLTEKVRHYVSDPRLFDPRDPRTWPAHATGAALDLTLRDRISGELLDLGTHFDDMSTASHSDYFERLLHHGRIGPDDDRLRNRRLLHWAMQAEGFANYTYECWHFDYGDQMYVMMRGYLDREAGRSAWYGYVPAPTAD